jgi:YVTN family beta-propeller protein
VTRLDPGSGRILASVAVGVNPVWPAVASDGTILVPNNGDQTVSRIDPETNAVVETFATGPGPAVIRPAFGDLWLTHLRGSEVWRIHVDG